MGKASMSSPWDRSPARAAPSAPVGVTSVSVFETGSKSKMWVGGLKNGVSTANITWPLGSMAPGASSAPWAPGTVGPAVQVLVEGL